MLKLEIKFETLWLSYAVRQFIAKNESPKSINSAISAFGHGMRTAAEVHK